MDRTLRREISLRRHPQARHKTPRGIGVQRWRNPRRAKSRRRLPPHPRRHGFLESGEKFHRARIHPASHSLRPRDRSRTRRNRRKIQRTPLRSLRRDRRFLSISMEHRRQAPARAQPRPPTWRTHRKALDRRHDKHRSTPPRCKRL